MSQPTQNTSGSATATATLVSVEQGRVVVALAGAWFLRNGFPDADVLRRNIATAAAQSGTGGSPVFSQPALTAKSSADFSRANGVHATPAPATLPTGETPVPLPAAASPTLTLSFDCEKLGAYDSSLPAYLFALTHDGAGIAAAAAPAPTLPILALDTATLPAAVARMLALAEARPAAAAAAHSTTDNVTPPAAGRGAILYNLGAWVLAAVRAWSVALAFVGETLQAFLRLLRGRARCRFRECWLFIEACGVDAIPIIGLISLLTGLILAYVGALQMRQVGAMLYVPGGVAISMMREMGVLMVAVVLCGRTATAYAAQLGSMKVSEEMAAFRSMGVPPVEYLVLPRILALVAMTPLLTLYANLFGIVGGLFVTAPMGVSLEQSYNMTAITMTLPNFTSGLIKSVVFAVLIGWVGCYRGMVCGRSSQAVGDAATSAAVLGITLVIITDAIFAVLFNVIDFF